MKLAGEGLLVRIFIGESDRWDGASLYEAIVQRAREKGLAGATVLRGVEGFGAHNLIHTARIMRLAEDLPIIIEIVDQKEKIEAFLPELDNHSDAHNVIRKLIERGFSDKQIAKILRDNWLRVLRQLL